MEANAKRNLNTLKLKKANEEKLQHRSLQQANLVEKLEASSMSHKAGKDGKTFGSISTKEIHQAIHDQLKSEVDKKKLLFQNQSRHRNLP